MRSFTLSSSNAVRSDTRNIRLKSGQLVVLEWTLKLFFHKPSFFSHILVRYGPISSCLSDDSHCMIYTEAVIRGPSALSFNPRPCGAFPSVYRVCGGVEAELTRATLRYRLRYATFASLTKTALRDYGTLYFATLPSYEF